MRKATVTVSTVRRAMWSLVMGMGMFTIMIESIDFDGLEKPINDYIENP